jgi:hypothetical protein
MNAVPELEGASLAADAQAQAGALVPGPVAPPTGRQSGGTRRESSGPCGGRVALSNFTTETPSRVEGALNPRGRQLAACHPPPSE